MTIAVTGCNGLLGQKLTELISAQPEHYLIATAKSALIPELPRGEFHTLDVTNAEQVEHIIAQTKPDVLIHTAAMTQVDHCETQREACWLANVDAVKYVAESCARHNVHLIHVSTDFIFDGTHGPLDESAVPAPVNYYGESKLAGEVVVQQSKTAWAILRTVLVYGITKDLSRSNIVLWVKKSLEDGKTIQVVNDQWRTPTLAEDLAMGCYLAATKKAQGIYHISGDTMMTPYDIAVATADFFQLDKNLIKATDSNQFKQPARRPLKTGFIVNKAKQQLGYQPHTFRQGLALLKEQLN